MTQKSIKDFFGNRNCGSSTATIMPPCTKRQRISSEQPEQSEQPDFGNNLEPVEETHGDILERSANTRQSKSCGIPNVPNVEEKIQPSKSFTFPQTNGRKVNYEWFQTYDWLHYNSEQDSLLCYTCIKASNIAAKNDNSWYNYNMELAFLVNGFRNWKKATNTFAAHQKSKFHKKCVEFIFNREHVIPVNAQLVEVHMKEQLDSQKAMLSVISSLRFLTRSGNAIRGHENDGGNLIMLLEERAHDTVGLKQWIDRRGNYLSPQIQNEIIEIMAHMVLRDIISEIKKSPWFSIIADGTTDVSGMEQFSLCVRIVNSETLEVTEIFLGMYNPHDSKGKTLAAVIKDVLIRLNLSMDNLRGHCFDGAANMSGHAKGGKILADEQPKSLFVHCSNHSADLALQEVARKTGSMCDLLCLVKDSSNCILESAKRRMIYHNIVLPPVIGGTQSILPGQLISMCPTRWCAKVKSLIRYHQEYQRVRSTFQNILEEKGFISDERKVAVRSWLSKLRKFETMLFLKISIEVFSPCEQLARTLQKPNLSATGAKKASELIIQHLEDLRSEEHFDRIYNETSKVAEDFELEFPSQTRSRKLPSRLEQTDNPTAPVHLQPKARFRKEYFEILDHLTTALKDRFDQEGLNTLENLENLLVDALQGNVANTNSINEILGQFAEDFDIESLHMQLKLLQNFPRKAPTSCVNLAEKLSKESDTTKALLQQVILLLMLIMTVPASAATSERTFSALRRLKTYLRATMSQKRLTHVLLLHVHEKKTAALDLHAVLREFAIRNDERKRIFGKV